jgi:hypothetical protein
MTWMRPAAVGPKNRSRSSSLVVGTGHTQPRGQSRGNQKLGACRVSTAHTRGEATGSAPGRGSNRPRDGSSL